MTGVPYLWGGTSVKGVDCSGMVKTAYFAGGIVIARDASQQALTGERLARRRPRCLKGDLIFFGNPASGRVTHVAMYLGEGRFIHSAGRVKINSLDPVGRRLSADELSVDQPNRNADRNARHHGGPVASMVFRHPITTHPNPI